jgi:ergothioneine biosynthesis protein EgtB
VSAALDDAWAIRRADAELLSLALIDARNQTLRWLASFEARDALAPVPGGRSPQWLAGHAGWWQEFWIARHPQRRRGEHGDPAGVRLASVEPQADDWFRGPAAAGPASPSALRGYLQQTLETTLDLLAATDPSDDALHFFRLALLHEDRLGEALAETAAARQLAAAGAMPLPAGPVPARPDREPLWWPAQCMALGSVPGGLVPDNERWAHEVAVPAFEVDAQPVSWARFAEFAEDGGYDRRECWSEAGWAWAQAEGRRAPRHVEQLRGGVTVLREGRLQRVAPAQPALHLSRHEAEAWCRWAGRRLPTEPEWTLAAQQGSSRGFAWGDVFEWTAGSARPWPGGGAATPGTLDALPAPGTQGVLKGASWHTRARWRHPQARRFCDPADDAPFCGFRSCAV